MQSSFGALAIDYDGTLTTAARPEKDVLDAIREVREGGVHVFLVTGRILSELRADFPEVDDHFDAIVAENGGVIARGGKSVLLARPVDKSLEVALRASGVSLRRGEVILATDGSYDTRILAAVERLELEVQLVFNRGALMLIPHDVTKGSGIVHALADAGFSPHDTVAIGDAENDHSLLDICEIERHWHKYISGTLPAERRFVFRTIHGPTGESAGTPEEFHEVLGRSDAEVLVHHASHGDFSRWIEDLSHDPRLLAKLREVEDKLRTGPGSAEWEENRRMLLDAIESCYERREVWHSGGSN